MTGQHAADIVLLPFVPYALSLALSAACRDFRHSSVATKRSRARAQLLLACQQLQKLGKVFWSAAFMAEMAMKILQDPQNQQPGVAPPAPTTAPLLVVPHFRPVETEPATEPTRDSTFDFLNQEWNLEDLEGLLESNLDPSIPSFLQDLDCHGV